MWVYEDQQMLAYPGLESNLSFRYELDQLLVNANEFDLPGFEIIVVVLLGFFFYPRHFLRYYPVRPN